MDWRSNQSTRVRKAAIDPWSVKVFVFVERLFCESDAVEDASNQEQDSLADDIGQDAKREQQNNVHSA